MPVNGYEARVVMALLQCAETLQGDLKVAIKEDKDCAEGEGGKEEYWDGYHSVLQKLFGQAETQREQHWWYSSDLSLVTTTSSSNLGRESFIDLNLLALAEEDDANQFEDSAVSDADFVNPVKVFPS
ncbi:MutS2 protein [Arachis hypogaea]|uniref:MutS2 protein n=1 Tax=Arachis hypogaea TaxID=3818 RepID=A0A6B9VA10_ARAHY|nr:MutS2 protein [Arachis hypogaea]